jgi:hypothetical protein
MSLKHESISILRHWLFEVDDLRRQISDGMTGSSSRVSVELLRSANRDLCKGLAEKFVEFTKRHNIGTDGDRENFWGEVLVWTLNLDSSIKPWSFFRKSFSQINEFDTSYNFDTRYNNFFETYYRNNTDENSTTMSELHYRTNFNDCFLLKFCNSKHSAFQLDIKDLTRTEICSVSCDGINEWRGKAVTFLSHLQSDIDAAWEPKHHDTFKELCKDYPAIEFCGNASENSQKVKAAFTQGLPWAFILYCFKNAKLIDQEVFVYFFPSQPPLGNRKYIDPLLATSFVLATSKELRDEEIELLLSVSAATQPKVAEFVVERFLNLRFLQSIVRVAKAAVFSRNFSHVTGSHVISNPNFAEQLVTNGRANLLSHFNAAKKKFDENFKAEVAYQKKTGPPPASIPWEPWNNVACLLSDSIERLENPRLDLSGINRFHGYLQARFDFIARAIEDTQDQPEPVFFIAELFNGFLEQEEFLDTLVADLGVRLANMKFVVRFEFGDNDSSQVFFRTFEQASESNEKETGCCYKNWVSEQKNTEIEQHDFLIGLPGGMIAAQAFYSLLENVIRNSVKYQSKLAMSEPYTLTIAIKDCERQKKEQDNRALENRYLIAIHDNWSTGDAGYEKVGRVIETPLVSAEGKPEKFGLGVQEMKLCAESLVTAEFESSLNETTRDGNRIVANGELSDRHQNLQIKAQETAAPLTFLLELEEPVLLGLVTNTSIGTPSCKSVVHVDNSVEVFKGKSAHMLVVDAQKQDELAEFLNMASAEDKNHRLLPCRVLVLGNGTHKLHKDLKPWVDRRRVHFLPCSTTYGIMFGRQDAIGTSVQIDANLDSDSSKTCCSIGWKDWWDIKNDSEKTAIERDKHRVLIASVAWLRAYKAKEMKCLADSADHRCAVKPWLLLIGFERSHEQIAAAWGAILAEFNTHSDIIKVIVRSSLKGGVAQTVAGSYDDSSLSFDESDPKAFINTHLNELDESVRKRLIVFDNHGKCFGKKWSHDAEKVCDFQTSVRYFQTFSGGTPDLYRILSRPPQTIFGFSFLIHSLVESCLTNVAIVDERLASDLMFGDADDGTTGNYFDNRLATHQKSRVFPIFTIASKSDTHLEHERHHYTPEHKSAYEKLVKTDACSKEGIAYPVLPNQSEMAELQILKLNNERQFELIKANELKPSDLLSCDVLIVHEGALDILQGKGGIEWKPEYDRFLYDIAPLVFRTSGRGRETKNFQKTVPFIEFHIVSSAVLTSRNKYGLIRGVLGATGQDI